MAEHNLDALSKESKRLITEANASRNGFENLSNSERTLSNKQLYKEIAFLHQRTAVLSQIVGEFADILINMTNEHKQFHKDIFYHFTRLESITATINQIAKELKALGNDYNKLPSQQIIRNLKFHFDEIEKIKKVLRAHKINVS